MSSSTFEDRARLVKVSKLLAILPTGYSRADIDAQADTLASWDTDRRRSWAFAAGVNPPSETTWAMFVDAARVRLGADEAPVDLSNTLEVR